MKHPGSPIREGYHATQVPPTENMPAPAPAGSAVPLKATEATRSESVNTAWLAILEITQAGKFLTNEQCDDIRKVLEHLDMRPCLGDRNHA